MKLPDTARPERAQVADNRRDALLGRSLEEKPLWTRLYESVLEALFPPKLPPLELTSTPIPVPDRMATTTNPWAVGTATIVNGGILAMLLFMGLGAAINRSPQPNPGKINVSDLTIFAPSSTQLMGGGGGGGSHELIDPNIGRLPRFENTPIVPPQVPLLDVPKLAIDPSVAVEKDIKLPDDPMMPNIGVHESVNVRLASGGPGGAGGIGAGLNGGLGSGNGIGVGLGSDRGAGDRIYQPGGEVSSPIPISTPEAEFSDEARRNKFQGICMIALVVDAHGNPQNPRVIRALGMGLDEKALAAVLRYRFKPAMKNGRPVPVAITVEVDFRLL
jgi:TonB family protein